MFRFTLLPACALALLVSSMIPTSSRAAEEKPAVPAAGMRFFELRKYTAAAGKLDALQTRFREHTNALFEKHGMTIIGFWVPTDDVHSKDTLIYILAYPSADAQKKSWKDFQDDPDWKKAKAESEKDGTLVTKVESTFMTPTDFSPIK